MCSLIRYSLSVLIARHFSSSTLLVFIKNLQLDLCVTMYNKIPKGLLSPILNIYSDYMNYSQKVHLSEEVNIFEYIINKDF